MKTCHDPCLRHPSSVQNGSGIGIHGFDSSFGFPNLSFRSISHPVSAPRPSPTQPGSRKSSFLTASLSACIFFVTIVAARGQSGFPEGGPAQVAGAAESPWQFSMGLRGRRLSASFGPPGPLDSRSFYVPKSNAGKGDVGLVTRPDQQVIYDDGFAGPDDIFMNPGTGAPVAVGEGTMLIDSASQFTPAISPAGKLFVLPGSVRFHTYATLYSYESTFDSQEVAAAAYAVGPYAQLRREVAQWESASLGVTLAWSFMMFDAGTAPQVVSRQTLTELRKDISF